LNKIDENWDLFEHTTWIRTYLKILDENTDQKDILTISIWCLGFLKLEIIIYIMTYLCFTITNLEHYKCWKRNQLSHNRDHVYQLTIESHSWITMLFGRNSCILTILNNFYCNKFCPNSKHSICIRFKVVNLIFDGKIIAWCITFLMVKT